MKIKSILVLITFLSLNSCEKDDTNDECTGNCTTIHGRIINAENAGISNVEVKFSYFFSAPYSYVRHIAKVKTNSEGYYELHGFIKDQELGGSFEVTVDVDKIETSLSQSFLKPSDIRFDDGNLTRYVISEINSREEVISIPDYFIPKKIAFNISLISFSPVAPNDYFKIENKVQFGFLGNTFIVKATNDGWAESQNSIVTTTGVIGNNSLRIQTNKNNIYSETSNEIIINNAADVPSLEYEY
jgi:hypothetical protein